MTALFSIIIFSNFNLISIKFKRSIHQNNLENSPFKTTYKLSKEERKKNELPPNKYSEKMWELSMNPVDGKPNPEKLLELLNEDLEFKRCVTLRATKRRAHFLSIQKEIESYAEL